MPEYREKVSESFTKGRPTLSSTLLKIKKFMGLGEASEPSTEESPEAGTKVDLSKKKVRDFKKGMFGG